jgi:hypothetical protein
MGRVTGTKGVSRGGRRWLAGLVIVGGLCAAGCSPGPPSNGVAAESPSTIFSNAMKLLSTARSVHFNGQVTSGAGVADVDATIFADGDVTASFTDVNGATAQAVKVGSRDYVRASTAYWRELGLTAVRAESMSEHWVSVRDASTNFGSTLSLADVAAAATDHLTGWNLPVAGPYLGQPTVHIETGNGRGGLYVASTGVAYPVTIEGLAASGDEDRIIFGSWDQALPLPSPPGGTEVLTARSLDWPILATLSQVVL